jgi:hypothetical protein
LLKSIAGVSVQAPWGPFSFNAKTHYPELKGLLYKVVQGPKRLDHKVLETFDGEQ